MTKPLIDLRSDTVTKPNDGMRSAMAKAEVGDDVYGEDPSVIALQQRLAKQFNKPAGLFFSSGTQSNLVALLCHCQRGDEYIVGQHAHTYKYEAGGAAVLGSIQPQPLNFTAAGTMALEDIEAAIKPDDCHFAMTRLIALENTVGGKVVSQDYVAAVHNLVDKYGLALHLDGARVFNAATALGLPVAEVTAAYDSVSICLSKGLGAPVGSVLVGSEELIAKAVRWRKMLGGGMRQAGLLAAAADYALDHNVTRLSDDHQNAERLAAQLVDLPGLEVVDGQAYTNMVFVNLQSGDADALARFAKERGIVLPSGSAMRLVTHLDISAQDIDAVVAMFREYLS